MNTLQTDSEIREEWAQFSTGIYGTEKEKMRDKVAADWFLSKRAQDRTTLLEGLLEKCGVTKEDWDWINESIDNHKQFRTETSRERVKILMTAAILHKSDKISNLISSHLGGDNEIQK